MCRQHLVHDLVVHSGWQHLTCILGDELSSASMTCLIISVARLIGWNPTYRFLTFLTTIGWFELQGTLPSATEQSRLLRSLNTTSRSRTLVGSWSSHDLRLMMTFPSVQVFVSFFHCCEDEFKSLPALNSMIESLCRRFNESLHDATNSKHSRGNEPK